MSNKHERHERFLMCNGCPAHGFEEAIVTVPITVGAKSEVNEIEFSCVGPCIIKRDSTITPGCPGAVSKFTVCQKLRVDIPLMFSIDADIGEGHVDFDFDKHDDHCGKCEEH